MQKLIILLLFIAPSITNAFDLKLNMASIYADRLIEQFDRELKSSFSQSPLHSKTYAKLIASRVYLENLTHDIPAYSTSSTLFINDIYQFEDVKKQIDTLAYEIIKINEEQRAETIYPSIKSSGNLTGNTFPTKVWSLTFDDGPSRLRSKLVVDNLIAHGMKANFFMLMRQVNRYPDVLDYILDNKMEVSLHSYNHKNLPKQNLETVNFEIRQAKEELEQRVGEKIDFFRLPYGAGLRNNSLRSVIAEENMIHVFWNVDTLDWKDKNPQSIFERTKLQMNKSPNDSGIILFHDIHAQTVIASEMVMNYLNGEDYKVCLLSEIVQFINFDYELKCNHQEKL